MNNMIAILSILVALVAVIFYRRQRLPPPYLPWHANEKWERMLKVYDRLHQEQYGSRSDCKTLMISTPYGETHADACGDETKPLVVLFHGAAANALMFGDWLVPPLSASHYVVAVDFPCDTGRSGPRDGDPKNCPSTQQELADWSGLVISHFLQDDNKKASVIGYSYGGFIAFLTALLKPEMVDKVVMLAPGGVLADFAFGWMWRMIWTTEILKTDSAWRSFFAYISATPNFILEEFYPPDIAEHIVAGNEVGATLINVMPVKFSDEEVKKVCSNDKCFLGIGELERVVDPNKAIKRAQETGVSVQVYKNVGHLMYCQEPSKEEIAKDVTSFLQ